MKSRPRSYPHPVLGNEDDVELSEFQANCTFQSDPQFFYLHACYQTSNPTLRVLLDSGAAAHVLHVECPGTFYRRRFALSKEAETVQIPSNALQDSVEVSFFICANADLAGYRIEGCHADYEATLFDVKKGDVLAVAEGVKFVAAKDYDAIRKVTSIMQVEKSATEEQGLMRISPAEHKIRIILPMADYEIYAQHRKEERWATILSGTIVLPALMEAIQMVEAGGDNAEYQDARWYQILKDRLQDLPSTAGTSLEKAQLIYERPVYRVCSNLASLVKLD